MATCRTIFVVDTEYTADSVEWCLVEPHSNLLACATYQLRPENVDSEANIRIGHVSLYRAQVSELDAPERRSVTISRIHRIDSCGILDMKWCPVAAFGKICLAIAFSDGRIGIYDVKDGENDVRLELVCDHRICDGLCLSLDWATADERFCLVVSDSLGKISVLRFVDGVLVPADSWTGHGYEAWISAYSQTDTNVIYTGGDDCLFKCWDIRDTSRPQKISREHQMGVCSIRSSDKGVHCVATGSYDESVLVWDERHMSRPVGRVEVGGGVWRLKWHPRKEGRLLAACMHNGFQVIDFARDRDASSLHVVASYNEHKSLAYGADWSQVDWTNSGAEGSGLVATCSFYDHQLHVWALDCF